MKEITETTTLRVSQDTHFGVASYKLVSNTLTDHTERLDHRELQDLERSLLNGRSNPAGLETHREELTLASADGLIGYQRADAWSGGDWPQQEDDGDDLTEEERQFLEMMRTVSEGLDASAQQQHRQHAPAACTSALASAVEELQAIMPPAIAVCEFN